MATHRIRARSTERYINLTATPHVAPSWQMTERHRGFDVNRAETFGGVRRYAPPAE